MYEKYDKNRCFSDINTVLTTVKISGETELDYLSYKGAQGLKI